MLIAARCGWECQIECRPCPSAPVPGVANLGTPLQKPCCLLSYPSTTSTTYYLKLMATYVSTHHTTTARDTLFTPPRFSTGQQADQPTSERYQGQLSSLQNVAAPSFPTSHILLQGRSRVSCPANLRLLRGRESLPAKSIARLESLDSCRGWHSR